MFALADRLGLTLCSTGTHPFSPWTEQRIIDTPHYRIVEGTLRYIAWRNNNTENPRLRVLINTANVA